MGNTCTPVADSQEYWSGLPCPPPGDLPDPGIEPISLTSPALAGRFFKVMSLLLNMLSRLAPALGIQPLKKIFQEAIFLQAVKRNSQFA